MRNVFFLLLLPLAGCCSSTHSKAGWSFQMGRPAEFENAMPIVQTSGGLLMAPTGQVGLAGQHYIGGPLLQAEQIASPQALAAPRAVVSQPAPMAAAASPCNLQAICDKLDLLLQQMQARQRMDKAPGSDDDD